MINIRLGILEKIYSLYEKFVGEYDFSCHSGCSTCCTRNVAVTSLESLYLTRHMQRFCPDEAAYFEGALIRTVSLSRFIPKTTSNGFARMVMEGGEESEEVMDPSWKPCPFLGSASECRVYEARPFNCRCMHSEEKCEEGGFSVLQEYVVTLNNVFLQYIEHLDKNGFVSNLADACLWMSDRGNMLSYSEGLLPDNLPGDFVGCVPMPFLMVPPEHQEKIRPVLKALADLGASLSSPGK